MSLARPPASRVEGARNRYASQGSVASPERALVLLYERLLRDLDDATAAVTRADRAAAHEALVHAQQIIEGLELSLDHGAWSGGAALASIYEHVHSELVRANITQDARVVADCRRVLEPLADAWRQAWAGMDPTGLA